MWQRALIQRHKTLARVVLYATPVAVTALILGLTTWGRDLGLDLDWLGVDWESYEEVQLLSEYVQIDTTNPDGDELAGAEFLARHLEAAGLEVHVERLGTRNANLWAILEGELPEALVLHNHIDTDPIRDPDGWLEDPFSGAISPPHLLGRGAFDMKSVAIAQLMALRDLAEEDRPPRRSVMFLATGDEEVGSWLGMRRFAKTHPEVAERFWAALTEGGGVEAISLDEVKYWGTEIGQRTVVDITICGADEEDLREIRESLHWRHTEGVRMTPAVARVFEEYAVTRPNPVYTEALLRSARSDPDVDPESLTPYTRSMARNDLVLAPVEATPEGGFSTTGSLILLPGEEPWEALRELVPEGFAGVEVQLDENAVAGPSSPVDHLLFQAIEHVVTKAYPGVPHGPLFLPWTYTDSRFFRSLGVPSYGFSPFLLVASDSHRYGEANERMPLPELVDGIALYRELVRRVANEDGE